MKIFFVLFALALAGFVGYAWAETFGIPGLLLGFLAGAFVGFGCAFLIKELP